MSIAIFHLSANNTSTLRQILRSITLIRAHSLAINKLRIRIRRIDNNLPIRNRQSLKAITGTKLSTPRATNRVNAAIYIAIASARCRVAGHSIGAWGCGRGVRVYGVGVGARGVGAVAGAFEGFDCPLRRGGCDHH